MRHQLERVRRHRPALTGRSSIPEAVVIEPMGRGVLDHPVEPGDDSCGGDAASRSRDMICPSLALRSALSLEEGAGKAGCRSHPWAPSILPSSRLTSEPASVPSTRHLTKSQCDVRPFFHRTCNCPLVNHRPERLNTFLIGKLAANTAGWAEATRSRARRMQNTIARRVRTTMPAGRGLRSFSQKFSYQELSA